MPSRERADSYRASVWLRLFVIVVLAAMYLAVAANVAIEANHTPETRALMVYEAGDLTTVTTTDPALSRGRYWIASTVRDVASAAY